MGRQMGFFGHAHAWRAVALACGIAWFGPASGLEADTIAEVVRRHRERERQLKATQTPFEPFDPDRLSIARGSSVLIEANQRLLPEWKPRIRLQDALSTVI